VTTPDHSAAPPLRVTVQDLRTARYCMAGARPWFRRHGFDWQAFLTHGIAPERLREADATLARPVIRAAAAREAAEAHAARVAAGREADDGRA
jgi:hypothetical protein